MKTPGPSKDELRADSRVIRSATVRTTQDRSRSNAVVFTHSALVCVQQLRRIGVVGSCSSPGRVTGNPDISSTGALELEHSQGSLWGHITIVIAHFRANAMTPLSAIGAARSTSKVSAVCIVANISGKAISLSLGKNVRSRFTRLSARHKPRFSAAFSVTQFSCRSSRSAEN